jgi:tetratricopeptide (TPR) repeat protein
MIQLCVSQKQNELAYTFRATACRVFSFEEAIFHVYGHWRDVADEFLGDEITAWVAAVGHGYLSVRMKEIARVEDFSGRLSGFLTLVPFFDERQMAELSDELAQWEEARRWEELKERADAHMRVNDPERAMPLYRRALEYEENPPLLNNYGVALLQMGEAEDALRIFTRALTLAPDNTQIMLHYVEAATLCGQYERAARRMAHIPHGGEVIYLQGVAAAQQRNYTAALAHFAAAHELSPGAMQYIFAAVDIHIAMRRFDTARETLARIAARDSAYYAKEAEIHAAAGDMAGAVRSMRAACAGSDDHALHIRHAAYLRATKDLAAAEAAIARALAINESSLPARLEDARIKKARGRWGEYREILHDVIKNMQSRYRMSAGR